MAKRIFALALSEHRKWGILIIPFMLKKERGESFFRLEHPVFPLDSDDNFQNLSNTEKKVVRIIDEFNDQNLFKLFSRHKSVKIFLDQVAQESIESFIRPFIEKKMASVFSILRGSNIQVFMRERTRNNIFDDDFLKLREDEVFPVFYFNKTAEGSDYSLQLHSSSGRLRLKDQPFDILCNKPCIIRINNKVLFVTDIEAKKLKPFFLRDKIIIPKQTEIQYFKGFARKIIQEYEVQAEGFSIHEIQPEKTAGIHLERSIDNKAVFVLRFCYDKRCIMANATTRVYVDFHKKKDDFYYDKFRRDEEWEQSYHDLLNDLGLMSFDQVNYGRKALQQLSFNDQFYQMVEWINHNISELTQNKLKVLQTISKKEFYTGPVKLKLRSELKSDWFDVYANVDFGDFTIPLIYLKKNIIDFEREYILPDGSIFIIPLEWFGRFKELIEFGKQDGDLIMVHKQHFFIIEKAGKESNETGLSALEKLNNKEKIEPTLVPSTLNASLRPYQAEGFTWLWYLQENNLGGCLADDMGLGKTLQAICLLLKNKEEVRAQINPGNEPVQRDLFSDVNENHTSLIVVPASLVHNWVNELKKFAPGLKIYRYIGFGRTRNTSSFHNYDVIISSYHTIRQDIELVSAFPFHYAILDESQVIKNPSSKLYRAMILLNSRYRMVLTGTPIENSLTDLWAQLNFINSGLLGSLSFFRREFVVPIEKKKDPDREARLKKLINPFILRRTKEEVAGDLPEMSEQVIFCNMTDEQRKFYDEEKSTIRRSIFETIEKEGLEKSAMIVLKGLTRLRQVSNHPVLVDENYREDSGKFNEIMRNIESILSEGHKLLVFSSFVKHLELVQYQLEENNTDYALLTGASTHREKIVQRFQSDDNCKVFLISLKAGGVGLNLTAADYVFILDPWWNPASEDQAVNRAHRIGQDKNVFVYRFISEDSIEEKIQTLQTRKTELAESFVKSNNPMKAISREQLEELFT